MSKLTKLHLLVSLHYEITERTMSPVPKAWQDIIMQETAGGVPAVPDQQKKNFVWSYYPGVEENVADRVSRLGNGV